jgi:hypothetical protein
MDCPPVLRWPLGRGPTAESSAGSTMSHAAPDPVWPVLAATMSPESLHTPVECPCVSVRRRDVLTPGSFASRSCSSPCFPRRSCVLPDHEVESLTTSATVCCFSTIDRPTRLVEWAAHAGQIRESCSSDLVLRLVGIGYTVWHGAKPGVVGLGYPCHSPRRPRTTLRALSLARRRWQRVRDFRLPPDSS